MNCMKLGLSLKKKNKKSFKKIWIIEILSLSLSYQFKTYFMTVINLCENETNRSVIIKSNNRTFILKNIGIGTYGTERIARLFIVLPTGENALVQTISFLKLIEREKLISKTNEYDCLIANELTFDEAIEISKEVIRKIYEN